MTVTSPTNAPAISVVIPLYNRAHCIERSIRSVLGQTFTNFELILVDDGSTDGGPELVDRIGDRRIHVLRQRHNQGANATRNQGILKARGQIISFLDSDDWFLPNKLETVATAFASRPDLDGLIDSFRKTSRNGIERECRNPALEDRDQIRWALFHRRLWKSTPGISVTRAAALRAGLFDENLRAWQDFDFLVRLLETSNVAVVSTITWVKTFSADSITGNVDGFVSALADFWHRHPDYYEDPKIRGAFAADLTRHFGKRLMRGGFRKVFDDASVVARKIGWLRVICLVPTGIGELRRLKAYRGQIAIQKPPVVERVAKA